MRPRKFEVGRIILLLTGCASAPVTNGYHRHLRQSHGSIWDRWEDAQAR